MSDKYIADSIVAAFEFLLPCQSRTVVYPVASVRGNLAPNILPPRCSQKRKREFAAGRIAAWEALEMLGLPGSHPLVNQDRTPRWPETVIGSISHDDYLAVATVCRTDVASAIGIDIELQQSMDEEIGQRIVSDRESEFWREMDITNSGSWKLELFSFKESIFKCLFPLSHVYFDFLDVEIFRDGNHLTAHFVDRNHPAARYLAKLKGGVQVVGDRIVTACWLPPNPAEE